MSSNSQPGLISWRSEPIKALALFQREQERSSDSPVYAVVTALSMLRDGRLMDVQTVTREADRFTLPLAVLLFGTIGLITGGRRLWPGGPMIPRQQANLARSVGRKRGFRVRTKLIRGTRVDLYRGLHRPDRLAVITLAWKADRPPQIGCPDGKLRAFPDPELVRIGRFERRAPFAAQSFVLVAHDPAHHSDGQSTPWGLIAPWVDGRSLTLPDLHWMGDEDLGRALLYRPPTLKHNTLILQLT